ncbi:hypothetical protein AB1283_00840 [Bacillus sp. S13(2024)]|uniref:hypothetical protein n=1 Tax=Bacillus sp. S13(2024) TaxID=3162885 RepID=UPI003D24705F
MLENNHTRIEKTIAKGVRFNLGGGAHSTVNLHLNEEGFLLIEGLELEAFEYQWFVHDKNLAELQILFPSNEECEEE